jgi:glycosidase
MIWDDLEYDSEIVNDKSGFKSGFGAYTVEQNKDLLNFYKDIIDIRNSNEQLKTGTIKFIYSDDDKRAFAFESVIADKKTVCVFNTNENELTIKFDFPLIQLYILNNDFESEKVHTKIYKTNEPIMIPAGSFGIFNTK